jgi:magnesium transporter
LVYDAESAGGLMTTRLVTVPDTVTVSEALDEVRRQTEEVEDFYEVFVVDARRTLVGVLSFRALAINPAWRPVREVMEPPVATVGPEEDQEEVARVMARYNLANVPVVDQHGQLLGCVTFDDVSDVVEAENTEDILRFGGVSAGEELKGTWQAAVKSRLPWLFLNLATAFGAGAVVLSRQDVISRIVLLAAYMPIVAGMGGNAGTQALAVTVRGLAVGVIPRDQAFGVIAKEMTAGLINGLAIGVIVCLVALTLGHGAKLGLVVFLAMSVNLFVAGFAGAFIPILLGRVGVDPAIASSIFVTTFTDVCGFSLLLGLASALLV